MVSAFSGRLLALVEVDELIDLDVLSELTKATYSVLQSVHEASMMVI